MIARHMIARHWKGWTPRANADAYEALLRETVIPGLRRIEGYKGGHILRRETGGEVEFVVINFFDSLDSVKAFAGPDYEIAVFEPEATRLLSKVETHAAHYEVRGG
jgi:heme-degrading monooxygenase HmoA